MKRILTLTFILSLTALPMRAAVTPEEAANTVILDETGVVRQGARSGYAKSYSLLNAVRGGWRLCTGLSLRAPLAA